MPAIQAAGQQPAMLQTQVRGTATMPIEIMAIAAGHLLEMLLQEAIADGIQMPAIQATGPQLAIPLTCQAPIVAGHPQAILPVQEATGNQAMQARGRQLAMMPTHGEATALLQLELQAMKAGDPMPIPIHGKRPARQRMPIQ